MATKGKNTGARVVSVKLFPATIALLKRKAKAEQRSAHAIMRAAIADAASTIGPATAARKSVKATQAVA